MTLHVHRGTATDALADGLADLLARPLDDPFAEEVIVVPARGVERWLAQRLSHRLGATDGRADGVSAGIRFVSPFPLVSLVLGTDRDDPWRPDHLAWAVLRTIDESMGEPWAAVLAQHLGEVHGLDETEADLRRGRRYAVARRLAGLFSAYAQQRPAMLADWRAGGSGDGLGGEIAPDLAWQPELWRRVLRHVDAPAPDERHAQVLARLERGEPDERGVAGLDLPGRLSLFGHTRIARSEMEILAGIARHREVHLWLPQASPAAWERLADVASAGPVPRDADESSVLVRHPLVASLGRDARELQRTLALAEGVDVPWRDEGEVAADALAAEVGEGADDGEVTTASSLTLLGWLQHDIARDAPPTAAERASRVIDDRDRSVQVHACHGQGRQVDVLRDVLAGLLEADPTLEPRDILVMCPDIDAYAPLLHAGFGLGEVIWGDATRGGLQGGAQAHPAHGLRVRLADRAPRHTNPLLALAARLVHLAGGRLTVGEVLDLAHEPVVRRRFGLGDDGLDRITSWVDQAGVKWGFDAEHRDRYDLGTITQNTWQSGLERITVGAALDGDVLTHLGTTLALDDLDSGDIDLAGRLAELVERLGQTLASLRTRRTAEEWTAALREGVLDLASVPAEDAWQVAQLERELSRIEASAAAQGGSTRLHLADVTALLDEQLEARATRANFRTGTLTVCTMVPMRSVPHRVVALIGVDEGVFPRTTTPDGDDALARRSVTGERDPRAEDRQLLLDAVMAARETLVITYTGADAHSGSERPPAVPLGELLDAVRLTATGDAVERVVTRHPLQPYDPRNLGACPTGEAPLLGEGVPFSFDPAALAGARAMVGERAPTTSLITAPLPPAAADDIELGSLDRFLVNPVGAFLRERLGVLLPEVPEERVDGIPLELDGLTRWQVGSRLLQGLLDGRDEEELRRHETWLGTLPPGHLGTRLLEDELGNARAVATAARAQMRLDDPSTPVVLESIDVDITLPDGRRLTGTVPGIVPGFPTVTSLTVGYSSLSAKARMQSWLRALVLAAAGHPMSSSHVIGQRSVTRGGRRVRQPVRVFHGPVDQAAALATLVELVDLRDRGLVEPLPLSPATALAWVEAWQHPRNARLHPPARARAADQGAAKKWETADFGGFPGEQDTPAHAYAFGERIPLVDLLGEPGDDERWHPEVPSRLGQLALRAWAPLLAGPTDEVLL